ALGRLPLRPLLGRFSEEPGKDTFAYLGAGAGAVHSSVTHGASKWGVGDQLLGGVSIPLTGHVRLRLETRYLLARDVDTRPRDGPGWRVNTRGTHVRFTVDRHLDTRFHPVLLAIDWRFSADLHLAGGQRPYSSLALWHRMRRHDSGVTPLKLPCIACGD